MVSKETGLAMEQRAERGPTRGSARGPGGPPYEHGDGTAGRDTCGAAVLGGLWLGVQICVRRPPLGRWRRVGVVDRWLERVRWAGKWELLLVRSAWGLFAGVLRRFRLWWAAPIGSFRRLRGRNPCGIGGD